MRHSRYVKNYLIMRCFKFEIFFLPKFVFVSDGIEIMVSNLHQLPYFKHNLGNVQPDFHYLYKCILN